MKKLRVVLVDDERVARQRLRRLLEEMPDFEIVEECADGPAAVMACREHRPEVLLLDIQMPGMDGFRVLEELGPTQQPPAVIFITAHDEHAVHAFEACALDYVLKPATAERLGKALSRARERVAAHEPGAPAQSTAPPSVRRFSVRNGGRLTFVAAEEIDWIEAAGNYAILHAGKASHMIRETMAALEVQLTPAGFYRLNRSTIANLHRVQQLHSTPEGEHVAILQDDRRLPITKPLREVAERLRTLPSA